MPQIGNVVTLQNPSSKTCLSSFLWFSLFFCLFCDMDPRCQQAESHTCACVSVWYKRLYHCTYPTQPMVCDVSLRAALIMAYISTLPRPDYSPAELKSTVQVSFSVCAGDKEEEKKIGTQGSEIVREVFSHFKTNTVFIPMTASSFLQYKWLPVLVGMHQRLGREPHHGCSVALIYYPVCLHSYPWPCPASPSINTQTHTCMSAHQLSVCNTSILYAALTTRTSMFNIKMVKFPLLPLSFT